MDSSDKTQTFNDISAAGTRASFKDFMEAARPRQWTKNAVVLAGFFFALGDRQQSIAPSMFGNALLAAFLFSITSSGIYVFNDIFDRKRDRLHPVKKQRPVASGRISKTSAWLMSLTCLAVGLLGSWLLSPPFALVMLMYVGLQAAYTLKLKHIAMLDVFVLAAGFVLRVIAGCLVVRAEISAWLLICTFLIALFLALCKRRHEKRMIEEQGMAGTRPSLLAGDVRLFDQLITVVAGATIIAYAIYTLWPDTVEKFGSARLVYTIPFVIFGLFRYLDLVYRGERCDQPEYILLTDAPLLIDMVLFGAAIFLIAVF